MADLFLRELVEVMAPHGFSQVEEPSRTISGAELLLKRQTFNTNRAIVAVRLPGSPGNFEQYLRELRRRTAFRCKFFPLLWEIGIQAIVVAPGILAAGINPLKHVAQFSNQWAIVQSIFLVDSVSKKFRVGRSWGQSFTGKFQDAIDEVLARHFSLFDEEY